LFSSADNSDPATNGRSYAISQTIFLRFQAVLCLVVLGGLLCWPAVTDFRRSVVGRKLLFAAAAFWRPETTGRAALAYGFLLCLPTLTLFLAIGAFNAPKTVAELGANRSLPDRVAAYLEDPKPYTAIFLGDSRTYCDIHPELLEPLVQGMHALNLSSFSNWFPTQLGLVREIVGRIPPGTQVIWSMGHVNFAGISSGSLAIQRVYPIGLVDALRLTWWNAGKAPRGLLHNVYYYHWYLHGFITAKEIHKSLEEALRRQIASPIEFVRVAPAATTPQTDKASESSDTAIAALALEHEALSEPNVVQAGAIFDNGRITSMVRYFRRGGYH
jgi:hypothetical protein